MLASEASTLRVGSVKIQVLMCQNHTISFFVNVTYSYLLPKVLQSIHHHHTKVALRSCVKTENISLFSREMLLAKTF